MYKSALYYEMVQDLINKNYFELISAVERECKKSFNYIEYNLSLTSKAILSAI